MRDVVIESDPAAVAETVAAAFLTRMRAAQERGETPHVALTGGTVARLVHRAIAAAAPTSGVDWSRIVFWWGDERFVGPGDPERNEKQAREDLLTAVGATQVHPVADTTTAQDVRAAADAYGESLRAHGAAEFDLVMLGMGPDGHVASLFPASAHLGVDDTIAVAVTDSPKPPPERVSLTFAALNRSRATWFLVTGPEKADATERAWAFTGSVEETPARGIIGPSITWYVDQAAVRR
jgi:6-phosphogluconolactonase